jgi:quercetin dioxygenase-like cupin family protein
MPRAVAAGTRAGWTSECELELDSGETITVHAGDIVVQRGANHVWPNRSDALCRFGWIPLDADPDTAAGRQ